MEHIKTMLLSMNLSLFRQYLLRFVVFIAFLFYGKINAADTLYAGNPVKQNVEDYCEWAYTDLNQSSLEDAEKILETKGFSKIKNKNYINNSFNKTLWFHLVFKNATSKEERFLWGIFKDRITTTAYEKKNGKYEQIDSSSSHISYFKRPYPMASLATMIETHSNETKDILLRIMPTDKGNMYLKQTFNTELQTRIDQIMYGGRVISLSSVLLVLFIFNCILAFVYRSWLFAWQSLYCLLVFIFNAYEHFLYGLIWDWLYVWLSHINKLMWLNAAGTASVFVFIRATRLLVVAPSIYAFLVKWMYIYLFCFWQMVIFQLAHPLLTNNVCPFDDWSYLSLSVANYASEIMMVILIIMSALIYKRLETSSRVFVIAYCLTMFSALAYASNGFHTFIGKELVEPRVLSFGLVIEIFLFTCIFFYKLYEQRVEKMEILDQNLSFQKQFTSEIINMRENERKRIAQDLHDDIGGTLGALKLHISSPNMDKQHAFAIISKAVEDLRKISHNLMPQREESHIPFHDIIKQIDEINKYNVLQIKKIIEPLHHKISPTMELSVFRIVNELLTNILKHAHATEATVEIHDEDNILQIIIEDNGTGFDVASQKTGIGLKNIHNRVSYLKGKITIDSNKNGTTFIIEIPL